MGSGPCGTPASKFEKYFFFYLAPDPYLGWGDKSDIGCRPWKTSMTDRNVTCWNDRIHCHFLGDTCLFEKKQSKVWFAGFLIHIQFALDLFLQRVGRGMGRACVKAMHAHRPCQWRSDTCNVVGGQYQTSLFVIEGEVRAEEVGGYDFSANLGLAGLDESICIWMRM